MSASQSISAVLDIFVVLYLCDLQYTMLTGKPPFLDTGYHELSESTMFGMMQRIKAGNYSQHISEWQSISDDAKKLIQGTSFSVLSQYLL